MEYDVYATTVAVEDDEITHYGICCKENTTVIYGAPLCEERTMVKELAEIMNEEELEVIHLQDVLDDWVIQQSLSFVN